MKKLNKKQLDNKIDLFLNKKLAKYPELYGDGIQGRNVLQLDKMVRNTLKFFEGKHLTDSKV